MERNELRLLIEQVAGGKMPIDAAMLRLKEAPFEDLGFAKLDHHRAVRQGIAEVIYGAGKTPEQIREIASAMYRHGQNTVLITRMSSQAAELAGKELPLQYDELSRVGVVGDIPVPDGEGKILVATGGTSDMPVADAYGKIRLKLEQTQ